MGATRLHATKPAPPPLAPGVQRYNPPILHQPPSDGTNDDPPGQTHDVYRAIFENAIDAILLADDTGRYVDANPAACRLLGYERRELLELSVWDVTHGLDEETYHHTWAEFTGNGAQEGEYQVVTRDGRTIEVEYRAVANILPGKHLSILRSISQKRKAERELHESEARFSAALTIAQLGTFEWDLRTGAVTLDDRSREIFGFAPDEGTHAQEVFDRIDPDDFPRVFAEAQASQRDASRLETEYRIHLPDGTLRTIVSISDVLPGPGGEPERLFGVFSDVTERKEAEEALAQARDTLEERVRERTTELARLNEELESFNYSVSHDLRAPLRALDGFSRVLEEDYGDVLDGTARGYLRRIRAGAERMGRLIDDLLRLSRLSRRPMQRQRVDLSALAERIVGELRMAEPQRRVEVRIQPGVMAEGDPGLLEIALENLFKNAWKATRGREEARIELGAGGADEGPEVFFVRDNGVGFDMRYSGKLFVPFGRLHSASEFDGTGIGLAIVQRIVHRHGGRIWAEGRPGEGAAFFFTLGPE